MSRKNIWVVGHKNPDTDSICAAFLHDTLEDCFDKVDLSKMKKEFGQDVM